MDVRDKKVAYLEEDTDYGGVKCYYVRNWKDKLMGKITFYDDWSLWIFCPATDTFFGPEFLRSLAEQMDDIQEKDEATWE